MSKSFKIILALGGILFFCFFVEYLYATSEPMRPITERPITKAQHLLAIFEGFLIFFIPVFLLYFMPSAAAIRRKHPDARMVMVLNLLLGWTVVGWIAAFIWACNAPKGTTVIHHVPPPPGPQPIPAAAPRPEKSLREQLEETQRLVGSNVLNAEEGAAKRNRLLGSIRVHDLTAQLGELKALFEAGVINQEEHDQSRLALINQ